MPDPVAAEQAPAPLAPVVPGPAVINRGPSRAERRGVAMAKLSASVQAETPAQPAAPGAAAPAAAKPAEPTKPAEPEKPDPAADRGLRAIEQARKKFLDEQTAWKTEREVQLAEVARLRDEAKGKVTSIDELKKLSVTDLLDRLDHLTDDDHQALSRLSYARTKAGKVDPRAQDAAADAVRSQGGRAAQAELADLRETVKKLESELRGEFTKRDQQSFAERWMGETVKAIPADKPSFLSKLHANEPDTARRELLTIGIELEKANDGQAPTHAEVIEEFEKRKRASLKAMGLDPDALLAPTKPAAPATKPAARTLDVGASNVTRPENAPKTREERREKAMQNLRDRQRATADQT